jgi:hypothetical protein
VLFSKISTARSTKIPPNLGIFNGCGQNRFQHISNLDDHFFTAKYPSLIYLIMFLLCNICIKPKSNLESTHELVFVISIYLNRIHFVAAPNPSLTSPARLSLPLIELQDATVHPLALSLWRHEFGRCALLSKILAKYC